MRIRLEALAAIFLLGTAAAPHGADVAKMDGLAWLNGGWASRDGDQWTEEHWTAARGGVMLGTNLSGKGEKAGAFEFLRIAAGGDGAVYYWAAPGGRTPVAFRLVSVSDAEAVFENPEHDFPTRIAYRREGDVLTATISGPDGANAMSWTFRRR